MTEKEAYKLFSSVLRKSIIEALESLVRNRTYKSPAERIINEVMVKAA